MTLKAFALVHFWSVLLLKEQMMTAEHLKTVKNAGLISRSISSEFSLKITPKLAVFYQLFLGEVCPKNSQEIGQVSGNLSLKILQKFYLFFMTYEKPV